MINKISKYFGTLPLSTWIMTTTTIISLVFIGYGVSKYKNLDKNNILVKEELASTTSALLEKSNDLIESLNINKELLAKLNGEVIRNDLFNEQIQSITSTVGLLDKLSKTDRELLQKYSNIFFLSDNFIPSSLSDVDTLFLYRKEKIEKIHSSVKPYLENLIKTALSDGVTFFVLSGYRSFGTQANLKSTYKITYGAGTANKFSADQGYSEHQLGSTVDFTATSTGETLSGFEKTKSYEWLVNNAYRFGFVISYPKGNKYFQFEPWHWRFVGVELATKLHTDGKYFYDLDQREINTYLIKIFD